MIRSLLLMLAIASSGALATPPPPVPASVAAAARPVAAEVRKVDTSNHRLTLRHEPITQLDMPAMTMVFEVPEPADRLRLVQMKVGQKIRFVPTMKDGVFFAGQLELLP